MNGWLSNVSASIFTPYPAGTGIVPVVAAAKVPEPLYARSVKVGPDPGKSTAEER